MFILYVYSPMSYGGAIMNVYAHKQRMTINVATFLDIFLRQSENEFIYIFVTFIFNYAFKWLVYRVFIFCNMLM